MTDRYTKRAFGREVVLLILAAIFSIPFFLLVSISLRSPDLIANSFSAIPEHPTGDSYAYAWNEGGRPWWDLPKGS